MIASSLLTPFDLHLFNEGTHSHLYEKLGAHLSKDPEGAWFAVWATGWMRRHRPQPARCVLNRLCVTDSPWIPRL